MLEPPPGGLSTLEEGLAPITLGAVWNGKSSEGRRCAGRLSWYIATGLSMLVIDVVREMESWRVVVDAVKAL